jgi:drug/metabolite transporter (DMT)-like permease
LKPQRRTILFLAITKRNANMSRAWAMFWLVGLIWGSSFLLIRVGVGEMSPSQVVLIRCAIAAIGLNAVLFLRGMRLPSDWSGWRDMIILGIGNAAVPYLLIGMGEQQVPSNVTSVLQSTTALFTMPIAHFVMTDERMTLPKIAGVVLGFVGVLILASTSATPGEAISVPHVLSILGGALSYAVFSIFSRRVTARRREAGLPKIEPLAIAASTFIPASFFALVAMFVEPVLGGRAATPLGAVSSDGLIAVIILGFVNTFIAYMFFYYVLQELGASRATTVTYVVPVVGLILGWLVLNEHIDALILVGAALIFAGIAITNISFDRLWTWVRPRPIG